MALRFRKAFMAKKKYLAIGMYLFCVALVVTISQFDGSKDYYGRTPASLQESPGVNPAKNLDKAGEEKEIGTPCSERKGIPKDKESSRNPASVSEDNALKDCPQ